MVLRNGLLVIIVLLALVLAVTVPSTVFVQTSPWSLFQQLCPTGRLATGPQCQNLQIQQQQQQQQSSTSSPASSQACPPAFASLCATQGTTAGSVNTTTSQAGSGTCPTGFTLQGNFCIPLTSTTTTPTGACPANSILQNGVCVP